MALAAGESPSAASAVCSFAISALIESMAALVYVGVVSVVMAVPSLVGMADSSAGVLSIVLALSGAGIGTPAPHDVVGRRWQRSTRVDQNLSVTKLAIQQFVLAVQRIRAGACQGGMLATFVTLAVCVVVQVAWY
jgi:hypothetical protein